jgi:hypothetical protein
MTTATTTTIIIIKRISLVFHKVNNHSSFEQRFGLSMLRSSLPVEALLFEPQNQVQNQVGPRKEYESGDT